VDVKGGIREALWGVVPSLVELLEHENLGVRITASSLLSNLIKYGGLCLHTK
jgi:hypothetical protein